MRRQPKALLIIITSLLITSFLVTNTYALSDRKFDSEVGSALELVNQAYEYGGNVSSYVLILNNAVRLYEKGNYSGAIKIINIVKENLTAQLSDLKSRHNALVLRRNIIVAILLSIPPLSYFIIPYIYYNLWYKFRRDWIVEEAENNVR